MSTDQGSQQQSRGQFLRSVEVNGGAAAFFLDGQRRVTGVMALDIAGGLITRIATFVNPEGLMHANRRRHIAPTVGEMNPGLFTALPLRPFNPALWAAHVLSSERITNRASGMRAALPIATTQED